MPSSWILGTKIQSELAYAMFIMRWKDFETSPSIGISLLLGWILYDIFDPRSDATIEEYL